MSPMERLRFNEEVYALLKKYSYKGFVGALVDNESEIAVCMFVPPYEPTAYYDFLYTGLNALVEASTGIQASGETTTVLLKDSSDNNEMPH